MALQPELFWLHAHGEAEHLRKVQDWKIYFPALPALRRFRLVAVKVQVAEGARRDHCVRTQILGLPGVVGHHLEGVVLVDQQNWQPAALGLAGVLDRLGSGRLDDSLQRRLPLRVFIEAQRVAGANDVAAVERRKFQAGQLFCKGLLERFDPDLLDQDPEQVLDDGRAFVLQSFLGKDRVDLSEILRVLEDAPVRLRHHSLAGAADRQDRQPHLLRKREGSHVQCVAELLISLLEDPGAGTGRGDELLALDAKPVHNRVSGYKKLWRAAACDAARVEGVLHLLSSDVR